MTPPIAFDDPLNQRAAEVQNASNAYLTAVISGDPVRIEAAFKAWLTVAGIPTWKEHSPDDAQRRVHGPASGAGAGAAGGTNRPGLCPAGDPEEDGDDGPDEEPGDGSGAGVPGLQPTLPWT
jgi:hypothetical protein